MRTVGVKELVMGDMTGVEGGGCGEGRSGGKIGDGRGEGVISGLRLLVKGIVEGTVGGEA